MGKSGEQLVEGDLLLIGEGVVEETDSTTGEKSRRAFKTLLEG